MRRRIATNQSQGFTLVEMVVSIALAALFLTSAYQAIMAIVDISVARSRSTVASNIAYSNLRQYVNGRAPVWFECDESNPLSPKTLKNTTSSIGGLAGPAVQHVSAVAPYGCAGLASGMPIRVESYVEYGVNSRRVTHVSYASY